MRPPDTPKTLLRALGDPGADEALWQRFVELYTPLIRTWLRLRGLCADAVDEETQTVLLRLIRAFRASPYDAARARFRTYLAHIIASVAYDRLRADGTRHAHIVPLEPALETTLPDPAAPPEAWVDAQFRVAALEAALDILRREPGFSPLHRTVLETCILNNERPAALARRLGLRANSVAQIRRRLLARLHTLANLWK